MEVRIVTLMRDEGWRTIWSIPSATTKFSDRSHF